MATRLCSLQQNKQEKTNENTFVFLLYIGIFLNGIITFGNIGTFCAVGTKMCRIENYLFYVTIEKKFRKREGDRVKQYNIPIEATLEIIGESGKSSFYVT